MKGNFIKATILCLIAGLTLSGCTKDAPADKSVSVSGVSLNETSKTLEPGETFVLTATVVPENATDKTIEWTSSNAGVAAVSDGTVTAVAVGTAVITVKAVESSKTASCTVTVVELPKITMTTTADEVWIYLDGSGTRTVEWGDGKSQDVTLVPVSERITHVYAASGSHTIKITGMVTVLACAENQLTALDISKNTALTYLDCSGNLLTALDVSKHIALTELYCFNNPLTVLDVSKNTALTYLDCGSETLTALDVSKNTALTRLMCINTLLTALDVSKNTALTELWCPYNKLTALDVSKNTALTWLGCESNQLTAGALNALFETLHGNTIPNKSKNIHISDNPGADGCNRTIATQKGWTFQ